MAQVETVRGPISPDELGTTMPHEHVIISVMSWYIPPPPSVAPSFADRPVTMEILGEIKRNPFSNKDNLDLSDENVLVDELLEYKKWGGRSIVEVTVEGIGRDPIALKRFSEKTGLNIITTTGWYIAASHPPYVKQKSVDELAEMMIKDLNEGIGNTGIKAGVIGEIGCSVPHHPDEQKVLRAASRAQAKTSAGMNIHPGIYDLRNKRKVAEGMAYLDMFEKEGGDLSKLYLNHSDHTCLDLDYHRRLMDRGVCLSYDNWGMEFWVDGYWPGAGTPSDRQKVEAIVQLCDEGYDKQLVFAHDVCFKFMLVKYGGWGYAHVVRNIVPELKFRGVSEKQVRNILVENPKRILAH